MWWGPPAWRYLDRESQREVIEHVRQGELHPTKKIAAAARERARWWQELSLWRQVGLMVTVVLFTPIYFGLLFLIGILLAGNGRADLLQSIAGFMLWVLAPITGSGLGHAIAVGPVTVGPILVILLAGGGVALSVWRLLVTQATMASEILRLTALKHEAPSRQLGRTKRAFRKDHQGGGGRS
jgi:hypothetical protein